MANSALFALACLVAAAVASEPTVGDGTCVQDAVSAVQARPAVPEVKSEPEPAQGVDQRDDINRGLFIHKELHLQVPPELEKSRIALLALVQRGKVSMQKPYDCGAHPHMCQAPFDCQTWKLKDTLGVMLNGFATKDGHSNPRSWCLPGAEEYADTMLKECVARSNPSMSAHRMKARSENLGHQEMDASYCFAEGHCNNEAVTDNTTIEETGAMCDHRFGHRGWTKDMLKSLTKSFATKASQPNLLNVKHGFNSRLVTVALTKMSCAMGVYHCDVQYCKHTYCQEEKFKAKYSFLKPPQPGHRLQDFMEV